MAVSAKKWLLPGSFVLQLQGTQGENLSPGAGCQREPPRGLQKVRWRMSGYIRQYMQKAPEQTQTPSFG
jgi:hypothetical protein